VAKRRARSRKPTKKKPKKWIKGAIKRPGALKAKAKRAGALTASGSIKLSWLRSKAKGNSRTAKQARLAITMRGFRKKKGAKKRRKTRRR